MVANVTTVTDPALATAEAGIDGLDVVDGGAGMDTISYEGESADVTVNLGQCYCGDSRRLKRLQTLTSRVFLTLRLRLDRSDCSALIDVAGDTDRITVEDIGTEDEPNVVSTIEHVDRRLRQTTRLPVTLGPTR